VSEELWAVDEVWAPSLQVFMGHGQHYVVECGQHLWPHSSLGLGVRQ